MYDIYIVKNMEWEYLASVDNIKDLDEIVYKITKSRPNKPIQILQDGKELTCLNGTEYQYWVFKNRYIRQKKLGFNYIKSFINSNKGSE